MDLAMAVGMKQNEIVEPVAAAVDAPDDVVCVPIGLDGDQLMADQTSAFLSPPERPWSAQESYSHSALVAPLKV